MFGKPRLGSLLFSVTHQLAGNALHLPGFVLYEESKQCRPHYLWSEVCRNLTSFTQVMIPQIVPIVDNLSGITDHPSSLLRGANCTSQCEISQSPPGDSSELII